MVRFTAYKQRAIDSAVRSDGNLLYESKHRKSRIGNAMATHLTPESRYGVVRH